MDASGNVAKTCALKRGGSYAIKATPNLGYKVDKMSYGASSTDGGYFFGDVTFRKLAACETDGIGYFTVAGKKWTCPMTIQTYHGTYDCRADKDKYGVKTCSTYYSDDNWFAAVVKCGGVQNMPDMQDLADIASFIYGLPIGTIGAYETIDSGLDYKPLTEVFGTMLTIPFYILWSNEEVGDSGGEVQARSFDIKSTSTRYPVGRSAIHQVVCRVK